MKRCLRSLRGAAPAFAIFFSALCALPDAHALGEGYGPVPTPAAAAPAAPAAKGRPSSKSTQRFLKDYDDDYLVNGWSAVLTVGTSGAVEVSETCDVTTIRRQRGIIRALNDLYNPLLIYDVNCVQGKGYAVPASSEFSGNEFRFGYYDERPPGRHYFTLKYRAAGMVVPAGTGARLQWRWSAAKGPKAESVTVILPPGTAPLRVRAVESAAHRRYVRFENEIQCAVAGNIVTVPVNRNLQGSLDIAVDLPAGAVDRKSVREFLDLITQKKEFPSLLEYSAAVTIRGDRTIDRRDAFRSAPDNAVTGMAMPYNRRFEASFRNDTGGKETPVSGHNTLYLYGFDKAPCDTGNYSSESVCIPLGQAGEERAYIRYSMWGNYLPNGPLFFDLRFPTVNAKRTDRVRFAIAVPPFVRTDQVRVTLYLVRGFGAGSLLHTVNFESRWEGGRLIGEYPASLNDEQYLMARVSLPAAGFRDPGFASKTGIFLSYSWYFHRALLVGAFCFITLLLAGAPALIWVIKRKSAVIKAAAVSVKTTIDEKAVSTVRADDPAFAPQAFLEGVRIISGKIQAAWSNGDMTPVRNFVSQGVYNRYRIQLRLMREQERVENLMDGFTVRSIKLMKSTHSHSYHTLHVHINASALDITVPVSMTAEEKKRALERAKKSYFTLVLSFTRKRGAATNASRSLCAGRCPSCGSVPGSFVDSNKCGSCGAVYNSGEFDWVLSGIMQGGEWKAGPTKEVPGLAALEKDRPSLNRGVIEDRAACLFWQWIEAQAAGSAAPLARDATESFLAQFKPSPGYFAESAVSSVDLQEVADTGDGVRAVVLFLWSAASAQGKVPEHREHRLTIVLPPEAASTCFADHGCDACGAPLPDNGARACQACGSMLQTKNGDWLLDGVAERK